MTDEGLARRYRPQAFTDLKGQVAVQLPLFRMLHTKEGVPLDPPQVPSALLFVGGRGSGKTSTARIIGAALNCEAPGRRPCGECTSCVAVREGRSLDVREIDAASNGGVAEIRRLKESVSYVQAGPYRVVILDEAHSMTRDAFNALLKVLEEPPPSTIFILVTTEAAKIMPTVASRCTPFFFKRLQPHVIVERLQWICEREHIEAEPALLAAIAERADGGMRDALVMLDQVQRVGITTLKHFEVIHGETDFAPPLVDAMADGDAGKLFARLETVIAQSGDFGRIQAALVACLRDVLVLLTPGGEIAALGQARCAREKLAARLTAARVAAAMQVLWDLRTKNADGGRAGLDLAVVMCMERLHPRPKEVAATTGGNGHGRLDADAIRKMAVL